MLPKSQQWKTWKKDQRHNTPRRRRRGPDELVNFRGQGAGGLLVPVQAFVPHLWRGSLTKIDAKPTTHASYYPVVLRPVSRGSEWVAFPYATNTRVRKPYEHTSDILFTA